MREYKIFVKLYGHIVDSYYTNSDTASEAQRKALTRLVGQCKTGTLSQGYNIEARQL